jgi:hypothetical protein
MLEVCLVFGQEQFEIEYKVCLLLKDRAYFNPNAQTVNKGRKADDLDLEEEMNDWCDA